MIGHKLKIMYTYDWLERKIKKNKSKDGNKIDKDGEEGKDWVGGQNQTPLSGLLF